jgi:hypothetical protein
VLELGPRVLSGRGQETRLFLLISKPFSPNHFNLEMASDQTLEELIVSQLSSLNLKSDDETVEFVQGLVEEDSFLPEVSLAFSSNEGSIAYIWLAIIGQEKRDPRDARTG